MTPKKVLIVGGGRTGWMAAAYLNAVFIGRQPLALRVLELPDDANRGSAAATTPDFRQMLAVIGVDEIEFLRRARGTFRQATRYDNWLRGTGDFFYHPFDDARAQPIDRAAQDWLRSDRSVSFAETVSPQPVICDLGLAPRAIEGETPELRLKYTYHADEREFAGMLREIAMSRGVERYVDTLADVTLAGDGSIEAVITADGARLEADLFIDCTKTDASLIGRALDVAWVDCSDWLLCDRTLTMSVPYEQWFPGMVRPFTTATALSAGWVQDIPLQERRFLSYVYSSRHADESNARRELQSFEGAHARDLEITATEFSVGHRREAWVANCVALGTSGGFMEPLETAGQYLADLGTTALAECFPLGDDLAPFAYRYNHVMANRYYEILDFVNMQYCLTKRSDTEFWRDVSRPEHINDRLAAKLDFWRHKAPSRSDFIDPGFPGQPGFPSPDAGAAPDGHSPIGTGAVFKLERYEAALYGMQFLAGECDNWFGTERPQTQVPPYIINDIKRAHSTLPAHDAFLKHVTGMADYGTSRGTRQ